MKNDIDKLIDCCIDINSDYNISLVIYNIFNHKYRYNNNNNKWEYFNKNDNKWYIDNKSKFLKDDIELQITNKFIDRINYWNNISNINNNNDDYVNDCQIKINKLLKCCNKIKNKNYITTIIKEAKSLFEHEYK